MPGSIKKDVLSQVFKRVGGEEAIKSIVSLLNHLVYLTSKFARGVTQAEIKLGQ